MQHCEEYFPSLTGSIIGSVYSERGSERRLKSKLVMMHVSEPLAAVLEVLYRRFAKCRE